MDNLPTNTVNPDDSRKKLTRLPSLQVDRPRHTAHAYPDDFDSLWHCWFCGTLAEFIPLPDGDVSPYCPHCDTTDY